MVDIAEDVNEAGIGHVGVDELLAVYEYYAFGAAQDLLVVLAVGLAAVLGTHRLLVNLVVVFGQADLRDELLDEVLVLAVIAVDGVVALVRAAVLVVGPKAGTEEETKPVVGGHLAAAAAQADEEQKEEQDERYEEQE